MGPMKDGRGVLWSCLLRTSISEDANEASSLLQSRSMDITGNRELPYLGSDACTNDSANNLYCQMKKIYYESTSMSTPTPFSKNTMLHQRIEPRLIRNDGCLADWLADE